MENQDYLEVYKTCYYCIHIANVYKIVPCLNVDKVQKIYPGLTDGTPVGRAEAAR